MYAEIPNEEEKSKVIIIPKTFKQHRLDIKYSNQQKRDRQRKEKQLLNLKRFNK